MSNTDFAEWASKSSKPKEQIVGAWHKSQVIHCFDDDEHLEQIVRENRQTLGSPKRIKLFTPSNYVFSTKAGKRLETIYFKNCATRQTGRLRQQHPKGPLAKVDKKAKTHLFLSKDRFVELKRWRKTQKGFPPKNTQKGGPPKFDSCETRCEVGKHHIEFACDEKGVSHWHASEGTVQIKTKGLQRYVGDALKGILGIRQK
jgi:hypothetical protein